MTTNPLPDGWIVLSPCATEDSADCYWDAQLQGNGQGRSFVNYDGLTIPARTMDGYEIGLVGVHPETFAWDAQTGYSDGYTVAYYGVDPDPEPAGFIVPALNLTPAVLFVGVVLICAMIALARMVIVNTRKEVA